MALVGGSHHGLEARTSTSLRVGVVQPLLTDLYQITMAYAYWKSGKHDDEAVFDLFFRKNPFQGEFTVFAGLEDCIRFLQAFRYSESEAYVRNLCVAGFDGTSNVLAGKLFNIPLRGTHAHAFVMSFSCLDDCKLRMLKPANGDQEVDFLALCCKWRKELTGVFRTIEDEASSGELAALISYAVSFPRSFLALVDTYDVLRSGLLNFSAVAMALNELGYRPVGVRIDSGDLAYLSSCAYQLFHEIANTYHQEWFKSLSIVASNDINEETIVSLNEQGHKINSFGIGTHLVTCQKQPALGCVYKLVEVKNQSCIKLSLDIQKVTIPGRKACYRLYGHQGYALLDLMQKMDEPPPQKGSRVLCRHPFQESKRAYVMPDTVEDLCQLWWDHGKVSVSDNLYMFMHELWLQNAPIGELS
ncbi:hypothetical protein HPB48_013698 [Haemaphysalis longicornis]|uniref:Nicotinate phosphoribosyltransferase n=1 Tax=Haemaphysalis longicornis TaxID=44386 RepID=A0A9J6GFM2_HAELO|nr:hypothetical protein HPB48_013698 [Haemaphysalis longicornis]